MYAGGHFDMAIVIRMYLASYLYDRIDPDLCTSLSRSAGHMADAMFMDAKVVLKL